MTPDERFWFWIALTFGFVGVLVIGLWAVL
jgi:hypothetical protein